MPFRDHAFFAGELSEPGIRNRGGAGFVERNAGVERELEILEEVTSIYPVPLKALPSASCLLRRESERALLLGKSERSIPALSPLP